MRRALGKAVVFGRKFMKNPSPAEMRVVVNLLLDTERAFVQFPHLGNSRAI
jgi:hypothetical protein